jgi:MoxR-like ATPase
MTLPDTTSEIMSETPPDEVREPGEAAAAAPPFSFDQPSASPAAPALIGGAAPDPAPATLEGAQRVVERLRARVRDHVMGRDEVIDLVIVAMLADGHILLEDYPGSGKTTLAKALGESITLEGEGSEGVPPRADSIAAFRRVQFTPDLLPSDITGVMVFDTETSTFQFRHGPVFAHVLLVDEINRTSPKVQAALLEAMAEKQVTVDNVSHRLDELFFVIATQNPLDVAGTYPLPLAQIDRFLFKVRMHHIDRDAELAVLDAWGTPKAACELPKVSRQEVIAARQAVREGVGVSQQVKEALVDAARALRDDKRVVQGVSTRSLVQAIPAMQTRALLRGRDFVGPEDLEYLLPPILWHRIELIPGADDAGEVILSAAERSLERLSKATLRRG